MVQKYSAIPMDRLRVVSHFEEVRLTEIRGGVVFVFAAWSGPAIVGFKKFTRLMNELPVESLDLVILDTDCLNGSSAEQLFGTEGFIAGGNGETLWVKDGVIVARESAASASEQTIRSHTKELLNDSTH